MGEGEKQGKKCRLIRAQGSLGKTFGVLPIPLLQEGLELVIQLGQWREAHLDVGKVDVLLGKGKQASTIKRVGHEFGEDVAVARPGLLSVPEEMERAEGIVKQGMAALFMNEQMAQVSSSTLNSKAPSFQPAKVNRDQGSTSTLETRSWLEKQCTTFAERAGLRSNELQATIVGVLDSDKPDEQLQGDLFDLLGMESFEFVSELLSKRWDVVGLFSIKAPVPEGASTKRPTTRPALSAQVIVHSSMDKRREKWRRKEERRERRAAAKGMGSQSNREIKQLLESAGEEREFALHAASTLDPLANLAPMGSTSNELFSEKIILPSGSERTNYPTHEEVFIPAPKEAHARHVNDPRVPITEFEPWAQKAFSHVKTLNVIQSRLFHQAYKTNENLLICAPTGAGKTNCAMMTILQELGHHVDGSGRVRNCNFKIVYVAPMKALAGEMTRNFGRRLAPLGIAVRELTGDMQLTRKEMQETHMLITTPEKWDVVTRKSGDMALATSVRLLIIDEVHLLHDDRGAVIESLVARTLRLVESSQSMIRIVGLSATLPNYKDVALFLRVNPGSGLFYFDNSYRPVPLSQTFIGVREKNPFRQRAAMDQVAYDHLTRAIRSGHQCMIFVHSRKGTGRAARAMLDIARDRGELDLFSMKDHPQMGLFTKDMSRSRNGELRELFSSGFGIHHAGMLRSDRNIVEKIFADGGIGVLCTTATLAWGINLPAHTVIILGTQVYDSSQGAFVDLGMLDVMQIFGRAGRPQFDRSGDALLITAHDRLQRYLRLLNHQLPIESRFESRFEDNLNAEIGLGTVSNVHEAMEWLSYTYLYIRMMRNPLKYGLAHNTQMNDPTLVAQREALVRAAASRLDACRMIRYDERSGNLSITDTGRTASHFYINFETIEMFNDKLRPRVGDGDILNIIALSKEFQAIKMREEESAELERLVRDYCPVPVGSTVDNPTGKVAVLIQTHISRGYVETFSLVSDMNYVTQNAGRIARALFDIALKRGWTQAAERLLVFGLMLERRHWHWQSELRQFAGALPPDVLNKLERASCTADVLLDMDIAEIGSLIRHPRLGQRVMDLASELPVLGLQAKVHPITDRVLRMTLTITAEFNWKVKTHGQLQPFWIWVDDAENEIIYHSEYFILHRRNAEDENVLTFTVPIFHPIPSQYYVTAVSDRWLGCKTVLEVSFRNIHLPSQYTAHTELLDLQPLPLTALKNDRASQVLYAKFTHFNAVQTQCFHSLYHTDENILLGAPTGSGKTIAAEIAMLRLFRERERSKVVYIAPLKALARERLKDWRERFDRQLGFRVVELTGDFTPDIRALQRASIIITTPEKWDGISRHWNKRSYVRRVGLVVIDEIHLLGGDRGPVLEVIVSRMRYISAHTEGDGVRIVGLSTALANAQDLAAWLGIEPKVGLFNFRPRVRPVPLEVHIHGFPGKHYCPRMATMNKPTYAAILEHSPHQPVLVFVSSRRQTRLTAIDLLSFCAASMNPQQFVRCDPREIEAVLATIHDPHLRNSLSFGIGMHHAGLHESDRTTVETLFREDKIQILVSTSTLAWGVNFPAHLVVVKGTEYYDAKSSGYVDFPITDVMQMIGRAGRPQFDERGFAVIMVHEPKKNFFKKFLYEPFPVESALANCLPDHFCAEVVSGSIANEQDALDYMTWTYYFRRLLANPSYYDLEDTSSDGVNCHLSQLVEDVLGELEESGVVELLVDADTAATGDVYHARKVHATTMGRIAAYYYLQHTTMRWFAHALGPDCTLKELLEVLCNTSEYDELPVRHNEDGLNEELAAEVEWDVGGGDMDDPHVKCNLLLQSHFGHVSLPIADYNTDQRSVLGQAIRIIQAMVDVCVDGGWLDTALSCMNLMQMVVQGRWASDGALMTLPGMDRKSALQLRRKGVSCLPELCSMPEKDKRKVLHSVLGSSKKVEEALQVVRRVPMIQVNCAFQSPLVEDKECKVKVILRRLNGSDKGRGAPSVFAPHFPKRVEESWWIVVGVPDWHEAVALKRIRGFGRGSMTTELSIVPTAITAKDPSMYRVYLMSDCWMGVDQECDIDGK